MAHLWAHWHYWLVIWVIPSLDQMQIFIRRCPLNLNALGVTIQEGYHASHLQPAPDLVIVGNAMKRGIEAVEYMLDEGIPYISGPQFLSEQVLQHRHVLAIAGTHGKTTTTTMLAWVLHYCGIDAGFLIGGVPLVDSEDEKLTQAFAHSSYLGADKNAQGERGYFVIEADEYDSAFFDKRSKFVHYLLVPLF